VATFDETLAGWQRRQAEQAARGAQRALFLNSHLPAAKRLLLDHGATKVVVFGSLATGAVHEASDVDLAVQGLPPQAYFRAMSELAALFDGPVDLVELERAQPSLRARIAAEGIVL
jgi:predicted nucleotidyltransferase